MKNFSGFIKANKAAVYAQAEAETECNAAGDAVNLYVRFLKANGLIE